MLRSTLSGDNLAVRPRESGDLECTYDLGTNQAVVVPAQAGTHNHQDFGYRQLCHIASLRRMGPRLRGDDNGESLLHIFRSGDPDSFAKISGFPLTRE
jgi:hypothetical protein